MTIQATRAPKRQPVPHWLLPEPLLAFDPGPSMRQDRRGALVSRGPGAVVLEDRVDEAGNPDGRGNRPVVRGARRVFNTLPDLQERGTITKRMHDAAVRFMDDCSMASGGGLVANALAVRSGAGPSPGLPMGQIEAIGRVRDTWRVVGTDAYAVVWWAVFDGRTLAAFDGAVKKRKGTGAELLRGSLERLCDLHDRWDNERAERREK